MLTLRQFETKDEDLLVSYLNDAIQNNGVIDMLSTVKASGLIKVV